MPNEDRIVGCSHPGEFTTWFDQRFIWVDGGGVAKFSNKSEIWFGKTPVTNPFEIKKFEDVVEWLDAKDAFNKNLYLSYFDEVAPIDFGWFDRPISMTETNMLSRYCK